MCPRAPISLSPSAPALAPPLASDVLASAVSTRSPPLGGDSARVGSSAAVAATPPSSATGGACSGAVGLPCRGDSRLSAPRNNSGQYLQLALALYSLDTSRERVRAPTLQHPLRRPALYCQRALRATCARGDRLELARERRRCFAVEHAPHVSGAPSATAASCRSRHCR
jgi:hypothetical protein